MPAKIVLASNNAGKLKEFQQLLAERQLDVLPQAQFNVPEVEETGLSFVENAIIKARHASKIAGLPAIADDSGLEVAFLDGAPGIYSARFSGAAANDAKNNQQLLERLQDVPDEQRGARFQCVLVYLRHPLDPTPLICQGTWEGRILTEARGANGFRPHKRSLIRRIEQGREKHPQSSRQSSAVFTRPAWPISLIVVLNS